MTMHEIKRLVCLPGGEAGMMVESINATVVSEDH